jgi:hypothetical protein
MSYSNCGLRGFPVRESVGVSTGVEAAVAAVSERCRGDNVFYLV